MYDHKNQDLKRKMETSEAHFKVLSHRSRERPKKTMKHTHTHTQAQPRSVQTIIHGQKHSNFQIIHSHTVELLKKERDVRMQMQITGPVVYTFSVLFAYIWVQKVKFILFKNVTLGKLQRIQDNEQVTNQFLCTLVFLNVCD